MGGGGTGGPVGSLFDKCPSGKVPARVWAEGARNGLPHRASWGWGDKPGTEEGVKFEVAQQAETEAGHYVCTGGYDPVKPTKSNKVKKYMRFQWTAGGKQHQVRRARLFQFLRFGDMCDAAGNLTTV